MSELPEHLVEHSHSEHLASHSRGHGAAMPVSIAGVSLRLRSTHDPETVQRLVRFVNQKIEACLPLTKSGSIQNAAILAALNLAEELFVLRSEAEGLSTRLEDRVARALQVLEAHSQTLD